PPPAHRARPGRALRAVLTPADWGEIRMRRGAAALRPAGPTARLAAVRSALVLSGTVAPVSEGTGARKEPDVPLATRPQDDLSEYRLPPGPKTPALFNGIAFLTARPRLMQRFRRRYGEAFTVRMPTLGRMVVVSRPDLIKQVFTAKPSVLYGGKNPLGEMLGPGSLFSMDEERHLEERR